MCIMLLNFSNGQGLKTCIGMEKHEPRCEIVKEHVREIQSTCPINLSFNYSTKLKAREEINELASTITHHQNRTTTSFQIFQSKHLNQELPVK